MRLAWAADSLSLIDQSKYRTNHKLPFHFRHRQSRLRHQHPYTLRSLLFGPNLVLSGLSFVLHWVVVAMLARSALRNPARLAGNARSMGGRTVVVHCPRTGNRYQPTDLVNA